MPASSNVSHEAAVMVNAFHVGRAHTRRLNARPGDRETVTLHVELLGQSDILREPVVLIAGHIARHTTPYPSGCVSKAVPDRFALAVFVPRAFVLVRGRGDTPKKSFRESGLLDNCFRDGARRRCGNSALRPCVIAALRERSTRNSSQGTGSKMTTVHRDLHLH